MRGRTSVAAEVLARTGSRTNARDVQPSDVGARALEAAARIVALKADLDHTRRMTQEAQAREALARSELAIALNATLKAAAADRQALRRSAAALQAARTPVPPLRRRAGANRLWRAATLRLGAPGQAWLLIAAGLWRGPDLSGAIAYVRRRVDPDARPPSLFDQAWYLSQNEDAAGYGRAPLIHYLLHGAPRGLSPHPLFHGQWYGRRNAAELSASGATPLAHFLDRGAALGSDPHPLFDLERYRVQAGDIGAEDPVSHYVRAGWREGLSPHPLFDPAWYRRQLTGPAAAAEVPPLVHYLTEGWRAGLSPHPLVDPAWYLERNPDVAELGEEPLTHFLMTGAAEGRNPGPWFDVAHYRAARGADVPPGVNPLVDYLEGGAWLVTEARPGLPTAASRAATPEIVARGLTPLEHWARVSAGGG